MLNLLKSVLVIAALAAGLSACGKDEDDSATATGAPATGAPATGTAGT